MPDTNDRLRMAFRSYSERPQGVDLCRWCPAQFDPNRPVTSGNKQPEAANDTFRKQKLTNA